MAATPATTHSTRFYLGTHMVNWLEDSPYPLFISRNRLRNRRSYPRARSPWALDSGGFTELQRHGTWTTTAREYATEVRRYAEEIGQMQWAAPQDWMCEPWVITGTPRLPSTSPRWFHGTRAARGLPGHDTDEDLDAAIAIHQQRTVANYLALRDIAPDLPFIPVLQGWHLRHYLTSAPMYSDAGIDLTSQPVVGLGSVCRRQASGQIASIVRTLAAQGLSLHGFGVKTTGLASYADGLVSADSMAWSMGARRRPPLPGHRHKSCSNCREWAHRWYSRVTAHLPDPTDMPI
ncbi:deazapurine DNA modification protein DpdA family protein [Streptomyces sp. NPDC002530]